MRSRHFDWTDRSLDVRVEAENVRTITGEDGEPVYEDSITFFDPSTESSVTGTVRHSSGYFDTEKDRMAYTFTVDITT